MHYSRAIALVDGTTQAVSRGPAGRNVQLSLKPMTERRSTIRIRSSRTGGAPRHRSARGAPAREGTRCRIACSARLPNSTTTASGWIANAATSPNTRRRTSCKRPAADRRQLRARAAGAARPRPIAFRKGVELIHKQMLDLLRKRGVTPIEALGADFDPNFHQAVIHEASPSIAKAK